MMTKAKHLQQDTHFRVLALIEKNPELSQRELAKELGVSLGGLNYALRGLVEKGLIKAQNFTRSDKKLSYAYILTPKGIAEKSLLTARFLKRKLEEYDALKAEIEMLQYSLNEKHQSSFLFDNEHYQTQEPGISK